MSVDPAIEHLHMQAFWICAAITVVVFGAMLYSLIKFRRSQTAVLGTTMLQSTRVEVIWTVIPALILVAVAIPAAELILKMEDMRNADLSIRVIGSQWKWQYQYLDAAAGIDFFSTPRALVVPSGTKIHLLLSSQDVIHAWYVPEFGLARSAIPGFVNELWFKVDSGKEGLYHSQCAALCGRDHGLMAVVVDVRTPREFKNWVDEQRSALKLAAATPADASGTAPAAN